MPQSAEPESPPDLAASVALEPADLAPSVAESDDSLPQADRARALASATPEMRAMLVIFTGYRPLVTKYFRARAWTLGT